MDEIKEVSEPVKKVKKADVKGLLVSKLDYPVVIDYKDSKLQVPPNARLKNIVASHIKGNLPKGLFFVETK
jgi:hypothetical protein